MRKRTLVRRIAVALGAMAAIAGAFAPAMQHHSSPVNTDQAMNRFSVDPFMIKW